MYPGEAAAGAAGRWGQEGVGAARRARDAQGHHELGASAEWGWHQQFPCKGSPRESGVDLGSFSYDQHTSVTKANSQVGLVNRDPSSPSFARASQASPARVGSTECKRVTIDEARNRIDTPQDAARRNRNAAAGRQQAGDIKRM
jgi:hypothetical protein